MHRIIQDYHTDQYHTIRHKTGVREDKKKFRLSGEDVQEQNKWIMKIKGATSQNLEQFTKKNSRAHQRHFKHYFKTTFRSLLLSYSTLLHIRHTNVVKQLSRSTSLLYSSRFFGIILFTKQIFTHYFLLVTPRLRNDLLCVEWEVKLYQLNSTTYNGVTFSGKYLLSTSLLLLANLSLPKQKHAHFLSFASKFCTASVYRCVQCGTQLDQSRVSVDFDFKNEYRLVHCDTVTSFVKHYYNMHAINVSLECKYRIHFLLLLTQVEFFRSTFYFLESRTF